jgi:phospholipid/cholesterol/gamma-HCH transport system substrate-binding protein
MSAKKEMSSFRLGLVIIFGLLLFSIGIFWIGKKQFFFQSTFRVTADFPNVGGLIEGAVVRVGGIQKGTVKQINLPPRPDQSVKVVMDVATAAREVIRKDSKASISSEGLIGDKYVEISFGSPDAPEIQNGESIQAIPPLQISDLINKANGLLDTANNSMQSIDATAENLKSISGKINQGTGTAGALINDKSLYKNMNAGVAALHEDMQALKKNFLLRGFFKNRGYEDSTELTKNQIEQLPSRPPLRQFVYDGEKLFDKPTTAKLKREKMLNDAGQFLEQNPFGLAVIAAYTDMKGDSEKDRTLTQARATVARDYLIHNFKIDDKRIKTIGLGKSDEIGGTSQLHVLVFPPTATKR